MWATFCWANYLGHTVWVTLCGSFYAGLIVWLIKVRSNPIVLQLNSIKCRMAHGSATRKNQSCHTFCQIVTLGYKSPFTECKAKLVVYNPSIVVNPKVRIKTPKTMTFILDNFCYSEESFYFRQDFYDQLSVFWVTKEEIQKYPVISGKIKGQMSN